MSKFPDPVDTIERFAELSATLDDIFAEEAEVLGAAGLDSKTWRDIEKVWLARLQSGSAGLAERFGQVYKETRERLSGDNKAAASLPDTEPEHTGFLNTEAQPWRAEAAQVGREVTIHPPPLLAAPPAPPPAPPPRPGLMVAETLESAAPLALPVLPFKEPDAPRAAGPDATLELGACLPLPVMPFTPRSKA